MNADLLAISLRAREAQKHAAFALWFCALWCCLGAFALGHVLGYGAARAQLSACRGAATPQAIAANCREWMR